MRTFFVSDKQLIANGFVGHVRINESDLYPIDEVCKDLITPIHRKTNRC